MNPSQKNPQHTPMGPAIAQVDVRAAFAPLIPGSHRPHVRLCGTPLCPC